MQFSPTSSPPRDRRRLLGSKVAQRAFTILEVVMATAVMSMGIATTIIAMQQGFKYLDVARGTTLASQILQSEIERIRMMSWPAVTDPSTMLGTRPVNLSAMFTSDTAITSQFTATRVVALDASRPSDVAHISIQVSWKNYDGRTQVRSFQTKYIKNGLYDFYYTLANPGS
ncbi:MAG: hypothetical protein Q8M02_12450 [Candidatus Didemnitutus sp.]|nr:hypothetical protein [Candidatus Didemnitutus sp.]